MFDERIPEEFALPRKGLAWIPGILHQRNLLGDESCDIQNIGVWFLCFSKVERVLLVNINHRALGKTFRLFLSPKSSTQTDTPASTKPLAGNFSLIIPLKCFKRLLPVPPGLLRFSGGLLIRVGSLLREDIPFKADEPSQGLSPVFDNGIRTGNDDEGQQGCDR
jgi:hypothetical protein